MTPNYEPDTTIEDVPLPPSRRRRITESDRKTVPIPFSTLHETVYGRQDDTDEIPRVVLAALLAPDEVTEPCIEIAELARQERARCAAIAMTVSDGAAPMRKSKLTVPREDFVRTASGKWCVIRGG